MSSDQDDVALALSAVIGGTRADPAWEASVTSVARRVAAIRGGYSSPVCVNVVYRIPGEVTAPRFVGARIRRYYDEDSLLVIDAALPARPGDDPDFEVLDMLTQAVDKAEHYARSQGIADGLPRIRELLQAL
jgi:hypothetical protein